MDPVSIGIAVAALLGSKAAEEFATKAGAEAWHALQQLRDRLSARGRTALDQAQGGHLTTDAEAIVAEEVTKSIEQDPEFRRLADLVIASTRNDPQAATIVAIARDNAKQVVINEHTGQINM